MTSGRKSLRKWKRGRWEVEEGEMGSGKEEMGSGKEEKGDAEHNLNEVEHEKV